MNRHVGSSVRIFIGIIAIGLLLAVTQYVEGHAILKESSPAPGSTVKGPDVPITLKYNVRIDANRSKLQLSHPDNSVTDLVIDKQTAPDVLNSKATGLAAGSYKIQWQVLAPDGHITRGLIPFTVAAP